MVKLDVSIKHAGKLHKLVLDTDVPPVAFKQTIQDLTGVPIERMKVMIKGGVLKDDTDWGRVAPKQGQQFMVVGTATELPKPPEKPIVFLEDMDESQLAKVITVPAGLTNLGNTCYMNASVQVLRAIPGLRDSLANLPAGSAPDLQGQVLAQLRDLYRSMDGSEDGITPTTFLGALRRLVPQFNEMAQSKKVGFGMGGYAQQDADECWSAIVNAMRHLPGTAPPGENSTRNSKNFVEQSMLAELTTELKCAETDDEPATTSKEHVIKVDCNITVTTNFLMAGIMGSLDETIEKTSPSLGRNAQYTKHSRFSRLPGNLTVHMVRFYWRQDIQKKAKIMRKVKFPFELDALEICTPELKNKLVPVNAKMKEIERDRRERRKIRRKTKKRVESAEAGPGSGAVADESVPASGEDVAMADTAPAAAGSAAELEDESVYVDRENKEIAALVDEDIKRDQGASISGLYDLYGIVTHKGASADSGHYIGYVRSPPQEDDKEDDEGWYKFDDEKVSPVRRDQITALEGGGEDSVAYILLYRARELS